MSENYDYILWENFCKTGQICDYLKYKQECKNFINQSGSDIDANKNNRSCP